MAVVHLWPSYMPTLVKDVGFYRHVLSALRQGRYVHAPFFCFLLSFCLLLSHFFVMLLESFHHTWVVRLAIRRVRESHR